MNLKEDSACLVLDTRYKKRSLFAALAHHGTEVRFVVVCYFGLFLFIYLFWLLLFHIIVGVFVCSGAS